MEIEVKTTLKLCNWVEMAIARYPNLASILHIASSLPGGQRIIEGIRLEFHLCQRVHKMLRMLTHF